MTLGPLTSADRPASKTLLLVTLQLWRDRIRVANIKPGVYAFDRRLPLHGQSPLRTSSPRSYLRLRLLLLRSTFGILPVKRVPKLFRGLADLTINGTPQVHAHVGRTVNRIRACSRVCLLACHLSRLGYPWTLSRSGECSFE